MLALLILNVSLNILVHELLCSLVILLVVLTRVVWVEVQMVTRCAVLGGILKRLSVDDSLRLVMQVVGEESFLRMELFLAKLIVFFHGSDNSVLVLVPSIRSELNL